MAITIVPRKIPLTPRHFPAPFSSLRIGQSNTFQVFDVPWSIDQQRLPVGRTYHSSRGSAAWHTHHTRTYCAPGNAVLQSWCIDRARGQEDVNKCNLPKKARILSPGDRPQKNMRAAAGCGPIWPEPQVSVRCIRLISLPDCLLLLLCFGTNCCPPPTLSAAIPRQPPSPTITVTHVRRYL
jgi:hypothetical protein